MSDAVTTLAMHRITSDQHWKRHNDLFVWTLDDAHKAVGVLTVKNGKRIIGMKHFQLKEFLLWIEVSSRC